MVEAPAPVRRGLTHAPVRRAIGLLLVALSVLPLYRLLDPALTGTAGDHTLTQVRTAAALLWSGAALALIPFVLGLRLGADYPIERWLRALGRRISSPSTVAFASCLALLSTAAAVVFGLVVLEGRPNLIDAMAQLVHARYLAEGLGAGPTELAEFFTFPNTVLTGRGWLSQYPPGHIAALAVGIRLGVPWLVGPVLLGVALFFTTLVAERAVPERRLALRALLTLTALSPFLIAHAGAYMNHTSAAAFTALTVYLVLRARDGSVAWALAAGGVASLALATRPLSALVMIAAVGAVAWGLPAWRQRRFGRFVRLVGAAFAGALPVTALQLWHNAYWFGAPLRFGYIAAYGPSHELGFGQDPWGNRYGLIEAIGYTSSDLTLLSGALFETTLPLVAIVGLFLLFARRIGDGERVILAWALAPVAANFFYWHHGIFMGPRMLNEVALAWALLIGIALDHLLRRLPAAARIGGRSYAPRIAATLALVIVALVSLVYMTPRRLSSFGGEYLTSLRIAAPEPPAPALVFVHGPWMSRVGSRLAAAGMRLDSIETALRQNTTCAVHRYADARDTPGATLPDIDFEPRADRLPPSIEISPDNYIRFRPDERLSAACIAQIRADERGVLELAPFLWQGSPPGTGPGGVRYVRDLGPDRNRSMLRHEPERTPYVFASRAPDSAPTLLPYDEGMTLLWGTTATIATAAATAATAVHDASDFTDG